MNQRIATNFNNYGNYAYNFNPQGYSFGNSQMFSMPNQAMGDSIAFGQAPVVAQPKEESFLEKHGGKLLLGAALIAGAALTHGKLWGKASSSAKKTATETTEQVVAKAEKMHTQPIIADTTKLQFEQIPTYKSQEEALNKFLNDRALSSNKPNPALDIKNSSLLPHHYGSDESQIGILTRTLKDDYESRIINIKDNSITLGRLASNPVLSSAQKQVAIDKAGDYLIQHLDDGRKLVSISVPTGRYDIANRPIRMKLDILSNRTEFTPMQKDMIEIISQRKNISVKNNQADILSIGCVEQKVNSSTNQNLLNYYNQKTTFEVYKDALLSSIATAKNQLKPNEIDSAFIDKALNLQKGERSYRFSI